jgi:AraC family transcriptional regulator of adaptative response/methylated-DNA-[protein]-cysteine methyltransferase
MDNFVFAYLPVSTKTWQFESKNQIAPVDLPDYTSDREAKRGEERGNDMRIRYVLLETELDLMLMAATEHGIAAVRFGASEAALKTELARAFPQAQRIQDDQALQPWAALLLHHLQGYPEPLEVALDVQGSALHQQVWKALQTIPVGSTRSYGEIAQAIGAPVIAQEVAQACATNPVAVLIPCHRVIRSNGDLGG